MTNMNCYLNHLHHCCKCNLTKSSLCNMQMCFSCLTHTHSPRSPDRWPGAVCVCVCIRGWDMYLLGYSVIQQWYPAEAASHTTGCKTCPNGQLYLFHIREITSFVIIIYNHYYYYYCFYSLIFHFVCHFKRYSDLHFTFCLNKCQNSSAFPIFLLYWKHINP